ncbi:MAG: recombinase RecT [Blautia sp.]|nr:recombinase RecT [Blautia sp.]
MAVQNSLAKRNQRLGLTAYLTQDAVKNQINKVIGGKNGQRFISSIVSATQANPQLQECTNASILSAALLGESLNLSPSPQLGQYYMVPYKDKNKGTVAQFQLGYKGYIQLAIRSGQYKKLNVLAIKEGELIRYDPLNEEIEVSLIEDEEEREKAETIGYYAMFEYVNGFRKTLYWSKKKMQEHAKKYSPGYVSDLKNNRAWTFWSKDFDAMAYKTMLRQLISKWGIMSIDMMSAMDSDAGVISYDPDGNRTVDYVENEAEVVAAQPADTVKEAVPVAEVPNAGNVSSDPESSNEAPADDIRAALFGGS